MKIYRVVQAKPGCNPTRKRTCASKEEAIATVEKWSELLKWVHQIDPLTWQSGYDKTYISIVPVE